MSQHDAIGEAFVQRALAHKRQFVASLQNAAERQRAVLFDSIEPNRDTAFGRRHDFASIKSIDDFRRAVPIHDYDALSPWIERSVSGEPNVLTAETPNVFFVTSGTSGGAKKLPYTKTRFAKYGLSFQLAAAGNLLEYFPSLVAPEAVLNFTFNPRPAPQPGGKLSATQHRSQNLAATGTDDPLAGQPGSRAPWSSPPSDLVDDNDRLYYRLRFALEADLRAVVAVNPSSLVLLGYRMREWTEELLRDVHDGTTRGVKSTTPNPQRAAVLRQLCERSAGLVPRDVWPRLEVVQCWTTGSSALYLQPIRELFGATFQFVQWPTVSSEAPLALPIDLHLTGSVPAVGYVFFEYAPAEDDLRPDSPTLDMGELEVGREYQVVLTQTCGLYRYAIGDVFRVLDVVSGVPLLSFVERKGIFSDFSGEKLTDRQVIASAKATFEALGLRVFDFTCCPVPGDPPSYALVLELESEASASAEQIAQRFDDELGSHNYLYARRRRGQGMGELAPASARLVSPGTFLGYREKLIAAGAPAAQFKEKHLHRDALVLQTLLALSQPRER